MERFAVTPGNLGMAFLAVVEVIGWPFDHAFMSRIFDLCRCISLVAVRAFFFKMRICSDQGRVDKISLVILFRLNWRRRSRSPFTGGDGRRFYHGLQYGFRRVAENASACVGGGNDGGIKPQDNHQERMYRDVCKLA